MKISIFLIFVAIIGQIKTQEDTAFETIWESFPSCRMGRLQSPIKLNITDSVYNSTYAIVYQNYRALVTGDTGLSLGTTDPVAKTSDFTGIKGGFINFQKGGVIKQYELIKFELYQGSHQLYQEISDYELHIVHKKVLGFSTSQNRYRTIQDANNYLVIVLRYSADPKGKASDNGLLDALSGTDLNGFDLTKYPVFQDKSSFYYEGAFMFNPCDEDVNYIVIEPIYKLTPIAQGIAEKFYVTGASAKSTYGKKKLAYAYERPIYRNFMNYTESLSSISITSSLLSIILFFSLLI